MNLNEKILNKKCKNFGTKRTVNNAKPFVGIHFDKQKYISTKHSTPSSKKNWGKSHISITTSASVSDSTKIFGENESPVILALSEGRGNARCEVGIAAINLHHPHIILCQISDTHSYINTLTKINILNPSQILVPMTFTHNPNPSRLMEFIKKYFPNIVITSVLRNTYNKANGMEYLEQLCIPSLNSVLLIVQYRYYALTAVSALLRYIQGSLYKFYRYGSIKIDYLESEGYSIIDVSTADRLELVASNKPQQASKNSTLFGVLNHCYTRVGSRALRTTILQPPYDTSIIEMRQNCVEELVLAPQRLLSIQEVLQKLPNIDQLLTLSSITPDHSDQCSHKQMNFLLLLNGLLELIEPLRAVLDACQSPFFRDLSELLGSEEVVALGTTLRALVHANAFQASGHNGVMQRCFAINPGINDLLDLLRKLYSERLEDMREYVKGLAEKHRLPLSLGNNASKGYHIVLTISKPQRNLIKKTDIPSEFIQICRLSGSFTMKTMELVNLSTRIDDIVNDILKISNMLVFNTLKSFAAQMTLFYKICEEVGQLDVIQSFAEASLQNNYVKPRFRDYTDVQNSQHPMLQLLLTRSDSVPNSIVSSDEFNIHVITGPNGSGKSVFIRQVMLLQIMAQIGCYVPAQSAVFKPVDRFFSRIFLEDNMECGASSFILEMKEVNYILNTMTDNSLIILDELARSTSLEEGAALAMAICEKMADSKAYVYVTSHFTLQTKLADLYPNVKNWNLETLSTGNNVKDLDLKFRYRLVPGVTPLERYGVFVVKKLWPEDMLQDVYEIIGKTECWNDFILFQSADNVKKGFYLKYNLEAKLMALKRKGKCNRSTINKILNKYHEDLLKMGIDLNAQADNVIQENKNYEDNIIISDADNYISSIRSPSDDVVNETAHTDVDDNFLNNTNDLQILEPEVNISIFSNKSLSIYQSQNQNTEFCDDIWNSQMIGNEKEEDSTIKGTQQFLEAKENESRESKFAFGKNSTEDISNDFKGPVNDLEENDDPHCFTLEESNDLKNHIADVTSGYNFNWGKNAFETSNDDTKYSKTEQELAENTNQICSVDTSLKNESMNYVNRTEAQENNEMRNNFSNSFSTKSAQIPVKNIEKLREYNFSLPLIRNANKSSTPIAARKNSDVINKENVEKKDSKLMVPDDSSKAQKKIKHSNFCPIVHIIEGPREESMESITDEMEDIREKPKNKSIDLLEKKCDDTFYTLTQQSSSVKTNTKINSEIFNYMTPAEFFDISMELSQDFVKDPSGNLEENVSYIIPPTNRSTTSINEIKVDKEIYKSLENQSQSVSLEENKNKTLCGSSTLSKISKRRNIDESTTSTSKKYLSSIGDISRKNYIPATPEPKLTSSDNTAQNDEKETHDIELTKDQNTSPPILKSEINSSSTNPDFNSWIGNIRQKIASNSVSHKSQTDDSLSKTEIFKTPVKKSRRSTNRCNDLFIGNMTRNELKKEFQKQDKSWLNSTDSSMSDIKQKYLNLKLNRPTIDQIKKAEHVATIRRTDAGTLVIPPKKKRPRETKFKKKKQFLNSKIKGGIDVCLFSDKNSDIMNAFLNSNEKSFNFFNSTSIQNTFIYKSKNAFAFTSKKTFVKSLSS